MVYAVLLHPSGVQCGVQLLLQRDVVGTSTPHPSRVSRGKDCFASLPLKQRRHTKSSSWDIIIVNGWPSFGL
jgi:hypothetical protein